MREEAAGVLVLLAWCGEERLTVVEESILQKTVKYLLFETHEAVLQPLPQVPRTALSRYGVEDQNECVLVRERIA